MKASNLACYECPKGGKQKLHRWKCENNLAVCVNCGLCLSKEDTADLYWTGFKR